MNVAIDLRQDPEYLRRLLGEARAELVQARAALAGLAVITRSVARRPYQRPLVADVHAERRILGALLVGRASLRAVVELRCADFAGPGLGCLFAVITSALELAGVPKPGPLHRRHLRWLVGQVLVRESFPEARRAAAELEQLPWPRSCPRDEIALVATLGRWRNGR